MEVLLESDFAKIVRQTQAIAGPALNTLYQPSPDIPEALARLLRLLNEREGVIGRRQESACLNSAAGGAPE
jgi:hypothetical protein